MKLLPIQLAPVPPGNARNSEAPLHSSSSSNAATTLHGQTVTGNGNNMDHRSSYLSPSELIWSRYPALAAFSLAPSPYLDLQNHIPSQLACDPRLWNKEDVITFFRWCEAEFDLPHFDIDLFQMNGKALCLLTKQDLGERCPGAGDLIYNVLRWLIRDGCNGTSQHLQMPRSPLTPHFPITPSWCLPMAPQDYPHASSTPTTLHNSVTLSPAPSVDSQSGSPKQSDQPTSSAFSVLLNGKGEGYRNGNTNGTNNYGNDDSDGEDAADTDPSPSSIPLATSTSSPPYSPRSISKSSSGQIFFPSSENTNSNEPNTTNGRLLWDFLQQLLNDSLQRYSNYITWKNRDSGIFKITDPPGLAKLWGIQKNHLSMNYDKMSRALRYYYRVNILRKVQGERHCYQFLRNPTELKSIKNISLLRQQMSPSLHPVKVKPEPEAMDENMNEDIGPTDLSLRSPTTPIKTENGADCFQYPQDLSISPVQLQVNMEAREAYRHSDSLSSSASNAVSSQTPIKIEDTS